MVMGWTKEEDSFPIIDKLETLSFLYRIVTYAWDRSRAL